MNQARATVAQKIVELDQIVGTRWAPEVFRRFQCVWLTHALDLSAQDIAKALDLSVSTVRRIRAEFAREGGRAIDGKGNRGGRRNQCMSFEEERAFLCSHAELLDRSGAADVGALKAAFEARVGRTIHKTTIYRLLERHGQKPARGEDGTSSAGARRKKVSGIKRPQGRGR